MSADAPPSRGGNASPLVLVEKRRTGQRSLTLRPLNPAHNQSRDNRARRRLVDHRRGRLAPALVAAGEDDGATHSREFTSIVRQIETNGKPLYRLRVSDQAA